MKDFILINTQHGRVLVNPNHIVSISEDKMKCTALIRTLDGGKFAANQMFLDFLEDPHRG